MDLAVGFGVVSIGYFFGSLINYHLNEAVEQEQKFETGQVLFFIGCLCFVAAYLG
jgi:hypothetical protein